MLSASILISCAIERYPISINRNVTNFSFDLMKSAKYAAGFRDEGLVDIYNRIETRILHVFSPEIAKQNKLVAMLLVISDKENLYNLLYLAITALAFENKLIYCFLLLDIIKQSVELQNVISSITKNTMNLLKFIFLGIIIMYIYGIFGYYDFKSAYDDGNGGVADSFILAITSTIKEGLRKGGGIGESLSAFDFTKKQDFWGRYFFELTFFICINMLFIQIIFGKLRSSLISLRERIYSSHLLALLRLTQMILFVPQRYHLGHVRIAARCKAADDSEG